MGVKGAFFGFLIGAFIDGLISPPTIRFRYYTNHQQWGSGPYDSYTYVDTKLNNAYRTLGISDTATDDEVRQAYKRLALKYHPDRMASQGEGARLSAERIFQQINQAKEIIFKARGLK
jgi:DnaJ-domain-containing protein 1